MLRRALDQALGQMQVGAVTMGGLVFWSRPLTSLHSSILPGSQQR